MTKCNIFCLEIYSGVMKYPCSKLILYTLASRIWVHFQAV